MSIDLRKIIAFLFAFIAMAWIMLLSSCYTVKVAEKQSIKAKVHYPEKVAELHSVWFPFAEIIRDSIIYKNGDTTWRYDTVTVDCDSVISATKKNVSSGKRHIVNLACPPCPIVNADSIFYYRIVIQENKAALEHKDLQIDYLSEELAQCKTDKAVAEDRLSFWKKWAILASIAALVLAVWKVLNWTGTIRF